MSRQLQTLPLGTQELLRTKLALPRLQADLVPRASLLARLTEGVARKLTLLSAPAGYGKTTLVSQWIHTSGLIASGSNSSPNGTNGSHSLHNPQVVWLSLDHNDNDPVRFWRYFIAACQQLAVGVGGDALKLLHTASRPPWENVLTKLINDLAERSGDDDHAVLVLEDYHYITSSQVHETLSLLLNHLPATFHLLITTRHDPPLPLAQMRARNELSELRAADLRFTRAEIQTFFQQSLRLPVAPAAISYLAERTEGWVAGLRLATLALQKGLEPEAMSHFLSTFRGTQEHIFTYLVAEVLSAQPEPIRQFLLQTCALSLLCGDLCDAVTGRTGSELLLEELERANLFVMPLAGEPARRNGQAAASYGGVNWYRYHALFAEAMQQAARRQLGEEELRALSQKASHWYEQHGMFSEAVETALIAQDFSRSATLIEQTINPLNPSNEYHTLRRWIGALPEAILQTHPDLAFLYAVVILFTSERRSPTTMTLLQSPLQVAERHWLAANNEEKLGRLFAFRALLAWLSGAQQETFAEARRALALLPEGEMPWRGISLVLVGVEQLQAGQVSRAEKTLTTGRSYCEVTGNEFGALDAAILLGEVYFWQDDLHQAAQLYQYVHDTAGRTQMEKEQAAIRVGNALLGLAMVGYEWNELERAEQQATQVLEIGAQAGYVDMQFRAALLLARIEYRRGEKEAAQQRLLALLAQPAQPRWMTLMRRARAEQARIALASGDVAVAEQWAAALADDDTAVGALQQEQETFLLARLQIEQGNSDAALALLAEWKEDAREQGRTRPLAELLIIESLAHRAANRLPQAHAALLDALNLAQPGGSLRLFADEGAQLAPLLESLMPHVTDEPARSYLQSLLALFAVECDSRKQRRTIASSRPRSSTEPPTESVVEPLSERESDVLRLVAAGLATEEVARELVISVGTVRTHLKNIYGKLDAHSRVQAVERARALNYL